MSQMRREVYPLKGHRIFITGVSRRQGIGYAVARQAAAWGASIIIHHYQPHDLEQPWGGDDLQQVFEGIAAELIDDAFFYQISGDFCEVKTPTEVFQQINRDCGQIDALVCNHALSGSDGSIGELTGNMLDKHWAVNTRSTLLLTQEFAKQHKNKAKNGKIIYMTSGQLLGPMPGEIAYAAAKGALAEVTLTVSNQLIHQRINLNTVNPGPVDTGYLDKETQQKVQAMFPQGKIGMPEDSAQLIVWLLSKDADWIAGQVINSEGGFTRWTTD